LSDEPAVPEFAGEPAVRVRVYIGERDHHGGQPLYTAIVQAARKAGLGGATVVKGIEGFGAHSVVHAARIIDMSSDLPIVIELVDTSTKMAPFVETLKAMVDDGMITLDRTTLLYNVAGTKRP